MAQVSISKVLMLVLAMAIFSAAVSAQEAPAPSPSPLTGAGFSAPVSGSVVGLSLVISVLAFWKH
ncbi:hypothetical protein Patl1_20592 [Pistacia atlantica]|uniref:Uncharacterized protein n=1 Tax=Pistacia atlantica TaxID=434234 RepID=A0ACC1BHG7_9ROSI|nr:hypothetical protein Patl1_20592 [Pistacia atlantica]